MRRDYRRCGIHVFRLRCSGTSGNGATINPAPRDATWPREVRSLVKGKMGKKYHCDICGQEVTVTKEGVGVLVCCNKPMREL